MEKRILILTAGFGEGHNAAARGMRDGLAAVAGDRAVVEVHDIFSETFGPANDWVRQGYLGVINRAPAGLGAVLPVARPAGRLRRATALAFPGAVPVCSQLLATVSADHGGLGFSGLRRICSTRFWARRRRLSGACLHHRFDHGERDLVSLRGRAFPRP